MPTDTTLNSLVINGMTRETFEALQAAGTLSATELYLVSDDAEATKWYTGEGITGTATTGTAFPSSGVAHANAGDLYLNNSTGIFYKCTLSGAANVALWTVEGSLAVASVPVASSTVSGTVKVGSGLLMTDGVLSVDVADTAEQDNTRPITSAAVATEVGNIEVLLAAL